MQAKGLSIPQPVSSYTTLDVGGEKGKWNNSVDSCVLAGRTAYSAEFVCILLSVLFAFRQELP